MPLVGAPQASTRSKGAHAYCGYLMFVLLVESIAGFNLTGSPCTSSCRALTCADFVSSLSCSESAALGCSCSGCCESDLRSPSPLPPAAPPPSLPVPTPPPPPAQPKPPVAPGFRAATSAANLATQIAHAASAGADQIKFELAPGAVYMLEGAEINVTTNVSIVCGGPGATFDAQMRSGIFRVLGGALSLSGVHLKNGLAGHGAGIFATSGSRVDMHGGTISNCKAAGVAVEKAGESLTGDGIGGALAIQGASYARLMSVTISGCKADEVCSARIAACSLSCSHMHLNSKYPSLCVRSVPHL